MRRVTQSLVIALIWSVAALLCLAELGVNLFPIIAAAGVLGIAIGFGAQTLVKDYLTGLLMLVENQVAIGEDVDLGEVSGSVTEMSLRTTTVRDDDGNLWHVPNGEIRRVCNKSQTWSRALLDLRLPYAVDLDVARRTIAAVTRDLAHTGPWSEALLDAPADPVIQDLGADAVVVRVSLRVRRDDKRPVERELRERIKLAFEEAGIELQLPQLVVHLPHGAT